MGRETNSIVADGHERLLADPDTQARIVEATDPVREDYRPRLEQAGVLGRLWLRWKMRREIRRVIERIAPSKALYFADARRRSRNGQAKDTVDREPNSRP